jgi:hypothetical protein
MREVLDVMLSLPARVAALLLLLLLLLGLPNPPSPPVHVRGGGGPAVGGFCARCAASPPRVEHLYLDLGANRGNTIQLFLLDPAFTLAAANNKDDFKFSYNPSDFRVVGVEAMRSTHGAALEALQRRFPGQVEIIWAAVGAGGGGMLRIYRDEGAAAEGEWGAGIQPRFSSKYEDVPTLDASSWLANNTCACDFVVVKCNIEGSEFALLDRMISEGTLCLMDVAHMYFHPQFFQGRERELTARIEEVYKPAFAACGVNAEVWSVHR